MLADLGLEVVRSIPTRFLPGLDSGIYKLYGGVIRDGAGRIVGHLATANPAASALTSLIPGLGVLGDLVTTGQLVSIGRSVEQVQTTVNSVLSVSMTGAAISGLGLITSVAGFAYLSHRLQKVEARLSGLESQIKEVRNLIKSQQKAQLYSALDELRQAELTDEKALRHDLLMHSKSSLATLAHYYRELWSDSSDLHEIEGIDEFYALSFTGAALATSELGMGQVARSEFQRHRDGWKELARQHTQRQFLRSDPARLLDAEYVKDLPARQLVELMDFAHGSCRGVDWLDDLRVRAPSLASTAQKSLISMTGLRRLAKAPDELPRLTLATKLMERDRVLDATAAHFDFLFDRNVSAKGFADMVSCAMQENGHQPFVVVPTGVPG